jgi:DNA polymerase-3 subunit gamma/tau
MVLKRKEGDLCTAYRPQTFSDVLGQRTVIKGIVSAIKSENRSHCYLFQGESGCGKTTVARIFAMALNCEKLDNNGDPCCECATCKSISSDTYPDFHEIDGGNAGGKDDMGRIQQDLRASPMFGNTKLYLIDEAHRLTSAAQSALFKGTEDMPKGIYIILCSTEPNKILTALRNRCEEHSFGRLSTEDIKYLVETVGVFESFYPSKKVLEAIISISQGRPRNALKALQKVINLPNETDDNIVDALSFVDEERKEIIELCRALTFRDIGWKKLMSLYKSIDTEPEGIRIALAGWLRTLLEKEFSSDNASTRLAEALELFVDPLPLIKPENKLVLNIFWAHKRLTYTRV